MSLKIVFLIVGFATVVGAIIGYYLRLIISLGKRGSLELEVKQMILDAKEVAKKITSEAEGKASDTMKELRNEMREKDEKLKQTDNRLIKKEDLLDKRQIDMDKEVEAIKGKIVEVREIKERAENLEKQRKANLAKLANLTEEEAKTEIINLAEKRFEEDIMVRIKKLESVGLERLEHKATEILTSAVQRLSSSVVSDIMSTTVNIPSDEMKGKIIGKEGRNIKAFERATGVEVIVDDTPGAIILSSFDPVRRQVARIALESLISDGRIQPAKIETLVEKAKQDVNKIIKEKGEEAAYECGVFNLDPRIISILGRLYFRTSYGQNVLQHSIEMSHLAGVLAEELKANVAIAKAGALLHDIGKAVDHEVAGTHVDIGKRILQKFGASEEIIKAMHSHHEEYPYETVESIIVQVADTISGSRPGARRDSVENYLKRLQELEAITNSFKGVEKSYALQAGREVRVFVIPEEVSDLEAKKMAREIALKIENELKYPGEIKVNVIRESRVIEFAR